MRRQYFSPLFAAANLWLVIALILFVGKKYERSEPTMYSFVGVGSYFYPGSYDSMVFGCLLVGLVFLTLAFTSMCSKSR